MVMPRSRSIGLVSSTCASISRSVRPPQIWMMRSASVDLPWSTCAMMEKLRMSCMGALEVRRVTQTRDYRTEGMGIGVGKRGRFALAFARACKNAKAPRKRAPTTHPQLLALGDRDRHEPAGAVAGHQQQHGVARLHAGGRSLELRHAVHGLVAGAQDHVAGLQAGLFGRAG